MAEGRGDLEERVKLLRGLVATEMAEDAAADIATAIWSSEECVK